MTDRADHIVWAAEAVSVFQKHCRSGDEHVIADLICDLGHLADDLGFDFLSEVRGVLDIGTRSSTFMTTWFSARMRQSKSSSSRRVRLDAKLDAPHVSQGTHQGDFAHPTSADRKKSELRHSAKQV